ncbi:uncharacterized protein PV09_06854 [Verruconis gallopava]|uniref:Insulin-induced protein n=1 Tax=Verruconis gallopava TaxID=253628 RepID=A0A0D1XHG4_9PEZI|nr:uncharacterized protein PV09_06854 [Verruconis gallopava]KIW01671.1 hypothetical protein PV09_06854 [Verruconis gallopava]
MDSAQSSPPLLRPLPRRPFQLTSDSSNESSHATTTPHTGDAPELDDKGEMERTQSILNLTSSTLLGIYAPTGFDSVSQPQTPWGTGAETPAYRGSLDGYPSQRGGFREGELDERLLRDSLRRSGLDARRESTTTTTTRRGSVGAPSRGHPPRSAAGAALHAALRIAILFACGLAYGALVAHLHDHRQVVPVQMEGPDREGARYLVFWGVASVALGFVLPWVDGFAEEKLSGGTTKGLARAPPPAPASGLNAVEWNDVVRSVGAFIGVAYAIRKTPWSSPLQLSVTLAMVNPFLWYILDRTYAGFFLSTAIGFLGILGVLLLNPSWVPAPSHALLAHANVSSFTSIQHGVPVALENFLTHERVGSAIWIGSVFFCSCVCFGNIGRLLATAQQQRR